MATSMTPACSWLARPPTARTHRGARITVGATPRAELEVGVVRSPCVLCSLCLSVRSPQASPCLSPLSPQCLSPPYRLLRYGSLLLHAASTDTSSSHRITAPSLNVAKCRCTLSPDLTPASGSLTASLTVDRNVQMTTLLCIWCRSAR